MKLPVFKAFFASIAYVITHILTIFKILWLPVLLMMAAQVYFMPSVLDAQMQLAGMEESSDPSAVFSAMGPMFRNMALLYAVMAVVYPMMTAGVLRHVVRGDAPRLPFYFQFGIDELRVLAAFVLLVIMTFIIYLVGSLAVIALSAALGAVSPALGGLVAGVSVLVFLGALVWFLVRMSVIFAAAIGEHSVGLADSWRLTKGNFWGLFFYWLMWMIALVFVSGAFLALSVSGYVGAFMELFQESMQNPEAASAAEQRFLEMQRDMWDPSKPGFWPFAVGSYLFMIVYIGLWTAAGGVAYRYLSGTERG